VTLFKNSTHQDIWIEHNCGRCWFGQRDCPILARALRTNRKPPQWERNPRKNALMQDSIKCKAKASGPPPIPRTFIDMTQPMFDVTPPVDMDDDHA
jgi:hypothetical protein